MHRCNLGVALEQETILGFSGPGPKRLLAPSLTDFRGKQEFGPCTRQSGSQVLCGLGMERFEWFWLSFPTRFCGKGFSWASLCLNRQALCLSAPAPAWIPEKYHSLQKDYRPTYPRHQNDYMQLFLLSGINFLKITITITFLIPSRVNSREM